MTTPHFPSANAAQIIRAQQRDQIQVLTLREEAENALRAWFGTRWLSRWDKEIELFVRLSYFGLTTGRGIQTLGEEYTDIWTRSGRNWRIPGRKSRNALVLLPPILSYILSRLWHHVPRRFPRLAKLPLPDLLDTIYDINLAIFYLRGGFYEPIKRILGIRYISTLPQNPNAQPPSYALLGALILIRLGYRLTTALRTFLPVTDMTKDDSSSISKAAYVDTTPLSTILSQSKEEASSEPKDATLDKHTYLSIASLPQEVRDQRKCALCLEERTATTATECGHLFCWDCITAWGREKAECPLCRQLLELNKLLPIYNL